MSSTEPDVDSGFISALYNDAGLSDDSPAKRPNKRGQQTRELARRPTG